MNSHCIFATVEAPTYSFFGKQAFLTDKSSYTEASFILQIFSHKTKKNKKVSKIQALQMKRTMSYVWLQLMHSNLISKDIYIA